MRIIAENIKMPIDADDKDIIAAAKKKIASTGIFSVIAGDDSCRLYRRSIDARRKGNIMFVCSVTAEVEMKKGAKLKENADIKIVSDSALGLPEVYATEGNNSLGKPIVIAGFGPAGMFCALVLAERGFRPIVLERGGSVDDRIAAVERFYTTGALDTECNIQFGAGGAGTFSDGKLTTRINDPRCSYILEKFREFGAPEDVIYRAKPHIGTDILRTIVKNIDETVTKLGGIIRYNTRLDDIIADKHTAVTSDGETIPYHSLVIATGHSARETYFSLMKRDFLIEAKPFSVGVRIEHPQHEIDAKMYGDKIAGNSALMQKLGHAEYALSHRPQTSDRGVYTFCMCPGGEVMAAASEDGMLVVNGMSRRARDGKNANSAVAVSVMREDFGNSPAKAIEFQRAFERAAFISGGGDWSAPVQTVGDFLSGKTGTSPTIEPSYMGGKYNLSDMNKILPAYICEMLKSGLAEFDRKIPGFAGNGVPLTGVETRTSAPVRIVRDGETLRASGLSGNIYPCGEGAGYAGGIMSAAADGIRVAEKILQCM